MIFLHITTRKTLKSMKTFTFLLILFYNVGSAQNVYVEISDYSQKIDGHEFSTYQFVDASYSYSRATLPIVTTKEVFLQLVKMFPNSRNKKSEYTDYWILGITNFRKENIKESDRKIIDKFYTKIEKYRADNNLPTYPRDQLEQLTIFISNKSELCKYINCKILKL